MDDLSKLPPLVWAAAVGAVGLGLALWWAVRWYGRYRARRLLRSAVTGGAADHLVNALVPDGMGGGFHVDFLLLTMRGVVVIDLRDVRGNIFGGDQMAEWTVMDGARRFTFTNPQSALYDRIAAVKAVAGDVPVEGRIVFTRRGKFPKGLPKWTLMVDALRAEFPAVEYQPHAEATAPLREGWQRLKDAVKPSYMADMR
ncbi:MAG TPA: nuclease-related domain-containing protein [Steroidobacteraceae bacterium]|nr:nuclease-related domain-containing protein [Steroidobacteraceae bacterium]